MNLFTLVRNDRYQNQAVDTLKNFMFKTNLTYQTKQKFNHCNDMRYRTAALYRKHLEGLVVRSDAMANKCFQDAANQLQAFFSKKKKNDNAGNKKRQKILTKIININPFVKDRILLLYMTRMKFSFTV